MKIYFEDGCLGEGLPSAIKSTGIKNFTVVDAARGPSECKRILAILNDDVPVFTNSILALNNEYAWNAELNVSEIYIRRSVSDSFIRIDKLTDKALRKEHNIAKMYLAGAFNFDKEM